MIKPPKLYEITWWPINPDDDHRGRLVGSEDYIEVIAGRLMDSFWCPNYGWTVEFKIKRYRGK